MFDLTSLFIPAGGCGLGPLFLVFLVRLVPGGIRVKGGHRLGKFCCVGTKILFVNSSRFVDNESHYTRRLVLSWVGNECESCGHLPFDDVALGSSRGMWSLAREDPEKIAIERNVRSNFIRWAILSCVSDQRVDRAIELIARFLPIQTIMFSPIADQFLCVLLGEPVRGPGVVLFLGIHQIAAGLNRCQFILANAAE